MSENNKIYVTTSSQTISTKVKVDNSGYFTEKAQQYAEQSEASAQKSQANVDRLLENEDFINVSQNLDLIVEAGQKIEGIDLEAILNAEASAKQSSESALASANLSEENAQTTITNAQLSKTYRDECEEFSETSKGYMDNTNYYYQEVNSLAGGCRSSYEEARTEANNAWRYSINASISETNALTYSNNAKTSEANALKYSNNAKDYLDEVKEIVPTNFTTLPIGSVISVNASANYTPSGLLRCDSAEYNKADFEKLWDNYLTNKNLKIDNSIELIGSSASTIIFNFNEYSTIVIKHLLSEDVITKQYIKSDSLYIENGILCSDNDDSTICSVAPNSTIYIKVVYSENTSGNDYLYMYKLYYSLNGSEYIQIKPNTYKYTNSIVYSCSSEINGKDYLATLMLEDSYYEIEGEKTYIAKNVPFLNTCSYEEYEGDLATNGQCSKFAVKPLEYDGSGLTIVGSPTITENGIASEFTNSNYIKTPIVDFSTANSWEMKFRISLGKKPQSGINYGFCGNSNAGFNLIYNASSYVVFNMSSAISGASATADMRFLAEENETYDIIIGQNSDVSNFIKYKKASETEYLNGFSSGKYYPTKIMSINEALYLGAISSSGAQPATNGSIDLKYFSIMIDGNTFFDSVEGNTFKVPTIADTELGLKNFVVVSNGTVDDCLATWNTLLELENYLKGV